METIGLCAPAYGAHALLPYAQSIFDVLAREVCNGKKIISLCSTSIVNKQEVNYVNDN